MLISVEPHVVSLSAVSSPTDRRHGPRQSGSSGAVTLTDNGDNTITGTVINESLGGLGIVFDDIVPVAKGLTIQVDYHGVTTQAEARHVTPFDGGGCLVGLQWKAVPAGEMLPSLAVLNDIEAKDEALREFISQFLGVHDLICQLMQARNWTVLAEMIGRLSDAASDVGVLAARGCLDALVQLLDDSPLPARVEQSIDELLAEIAVRTAELTDQA